MTKIEGINAQTLLILTYIRDNPMSSGTEIAEGTDIAGNYAHAILKNLITERLVDCKELTYKECIQYGTSHLSDTHYRLTEKGADEMDNAAALISICGRKVAMTASQISQVRRLVKTIEWENRDKALRVMS